MEELMLLLRVLLAAGLSGAVGLEREFHGRPAGLRTHLLVGIGSALVMVTFEGVRILVASNGAFAEGAQIDSGRLAAGIITGIGFLGAGTIFRVGDWVRGLTTAASIWFVAALGIVAGEGLVVLAVGATAIGLVVLTLVSPLEQRIPSTVYHVLTLDVLPKKREEVREAFQERCRAKEIRAQLLSWESRNETGHVTLRFSVRHRGKIEIETFAADLAALAGVEGMRLEL